MDRDPSLKLASMTQKEKSSLVVPGNPRNGILIGLVTSLFLWVGIIVALKAIF
jgi:hypothetical protein